MGGHAWFWEGGMCGGRGHAWWQGACMVVGDVLGGRGACVVAGGSCMVVGGMHGGGGCAWWQGAYMMVGACMVVGGMHGSREAYVVGGMHGGGGYAWWQGACMVVGACVVAGERACMVVGSMRGGRGACMGYKEIQSMSGQYASYWNEFLLILLFYFCG